MGRFAVQWTRHSGSSLRGGKGQGRNSWPCLGAGLTEGLHGSSLPPGALGDSVLLPGGAYWLEVRGEWRTQAIPSLQPQAFALPVPFVRECPPPAHPHAHARMQAHVCTHAGTCTHTPGPIVSKTPPWSYLISLCTASQLSTTSKGESFHVHRTSTKQVSEKGSKGACKNGPCHWLLAPLALTLPWP